MNNYRVLVVDDEHLIRWSLEQSLKKQGYHVQTVGSGEEALDYVRSDSPDLVFLDIQLPGIDGIETLEKIKEIDSDISVIMITALGVLETAVKAMQLGAYDYINKPFNLDELSVVLRKALETQALKKEVEHLRTEKKRTQSSSRIVAESSHMKNVLDMVSKIAQSDAATVLVQGESGTGKELVARALHYDSPRSEQPFMAINCAAVPETLLESELMGHEKGSFTDAKAQKKGLFELANGGTVFLDEIGDMPMGTQAKLLRVLEERSFRRIGGTKDIHVDVRIVAATNKELLKAIDDGTFRKDLYYRIQVIPIYLPPLRERPDDILALAHHFVQHFNAEFGKNVTGFSTSAERYLLDYDWPGNIRELRNVIERAIILESGDTLKLELLPREMLSQTPATTNGNFQLPPEGIDIEVVEKQLIQQALALSNGNQSQAARKLHLGIDAFRYRMKKFGLL
ncbi:sigma-54-dependent Fis family transcriptional regulator [Desulfuromonas acetoxidans]|uniref:Two component, sigma54 specific, transcriptional regulator, Fis family n=1 Tax=Desulfuromonas acetoxidans (strain DSM 684 / 11070) TaxID=281689 RepID=Q1JWJ7_DESA6|nr:sigma-54 dependent transcriptional regulator [Desulfuromonas acetoxidans]EAT14571.1 two component, sigma54 specific, transcriptional regulator, Fis family [Desulfuromonas acetoxidans DSM 684]MBF0646284.1 sigma-54-dependent Fis family transcriptional regulator [Desulfuromonas acetoxidans]NVD25716.1 sigma-54-dependent Fis family transcriptional regulator [Desulfuromonas acetoxidans]NVE17012.1 sigma-54-dependent Fis family transcriptional regulator [Desulfuromonas acetoxidans]